jgi:hypothetical protein
MKEHLEKFAKIIGSICLVTLVTGLPLWILWNLVVPDIFSMPYITFWQAVGLQFVSRLLFKNTDYKE